MGAEWRVADLPQVTSSDDTLRPIAAIAYPIRGKSPSFSLQAAYAPAHTRLPSN
jgi:hypothetical protein